MDKLKLIKLKEGLVTFFAPDVRFYSRGIFLEPAWAPVFYNPRMKLSRDIGVVIVEAFSDYLNRQELVVIEPLSATGIRGLRYLIENKGRVSKLILNDHNPLSYNVIRTNIKINKIEDFVEAYNLDAELLLYKLRSEGVRPDIIDLDPFGSPSYFLDTALKVIKHRGMICMTATDLPPLFGTYPLTAYRRYMAKVYRTEFYKECGVRILIGFVAREAARLDKGIYPLYSQATDHYIRLCVLVLKSRKEGLKALKKVGFLTYCNNCLFRNSSHGKIDSDCPICGNKVKVMGPLWLGTLWDKKFVKMALKSYIKKQYLDKRGVKLLRTMISEVDAPPFYYKTDTIAHKYMFSREISPTLIVEVHAKLGYASSLTHFDNKGFRSPLPIDDLVKLMKKVR